MPYIKKELRPIPDAIVTMVYDKVTAVRLLVEILSSYLKLFDGPKQDGIINYTLTQIMRRKDFDGSHVNAETSFIFTSLNKEFRENPSYDKFERCCGLLHSMTKEFERRGWMTPNIRRFLEKETDITDSRMVEYEDKKIKENGDL